MKKTFGFVLLILFAAMNAQSIAFGDKKKDKAIADFNEITVPTILIMAPMITQTSQERVFSQFSLGDAKAKCDKSKESASAAGEVVEEKTATLCSALVDWLKENDAGACSTLRWADATESLKGKVESKVRKAYQKANIAKIYGDLEIAAGCKTKDKTYWSRQVVNDYFEMAEKLQFDAKGNITFPETELAGKWSHCFSANSLGGDSSKVASSANWGCTAIGILASRNGVDYCRSWFYARDAVKKSGKEDVVGDRIVDLTLSFYLLSNKTGCEAKVNELMATQVREEEAAANAAKLRARLEPLYNDYNLARQAADESMKWVNIWEDKLGNPDRGVNTCRYYRQARDNVANAQNAARDIYALVKSDENRMRFEQEQTNMRFLNTQVTNWCK